MIVHTLQLQATSDRDLARAAELLRRGSLVAFPTETVYGLGANTLDPEAVARIFVAKGRPRWDPLIVHIGSLDELERVATVGAGQQERVSALAEAFWPGPLTMLLPRSAAISDAVTAGRARVGVRVPAHPAARALIARAGVPIAAPSANRFGHVSPTTAAHVLADLEGRIDAVLDGGSTEIGLESTVLDVVEQPMRIYRSGAVTPWEIERVAGAVELFQQQKDAADRAETLLKDAERTGLPSPGVGLRHYAPRARVVLVASEQDLREFGPAGARNRRRGVMLPDSWDPGGADHVFPWGPWDRPDVLAQRLFMGLRELDAAGVSAITCPLPAEGDGLAGALRDRLLKAAMCA